MTNGSKDPALQEIEARLAQVIGLDLGSVGPSTVALAVASRMKQRAMDDSAEYAALLAGSAAELQKLIETVVVPETWFFRDRHPFVALGEWVVKSWLPAHPHGVLRALSMPCSTGEEPFSIVMTLLEAGMTPDRFSVEAVDISSVVIERARRGIYTRNSFRGNDLEFRAKYFRQIPDGWQLAEHVRSQVQFRQANLLDAGFTEGAGGKDVIFCRNMLIYFDEKAQKQIAAAIHRMLLPDGLLFAGHAEAFIFSRSDFEAVQMPMAFAFRKAVKSVTVPMAGRKTLSPAKRAVQPALPVRTFVAPPVPRTVSVSKPESRVAEMAVVNPEALLDEAQGLADAGRFDVALEKCNAYLQRHGSSSRAFYLLGLVNDAAGKEGEAADCYRKALYLEPNHCEALLHLVLLAKKSGDTASAHQLQQRALRARSKVAAQVFLEPSSAIKR